MHFSIDVDINYLFSVEFLFILTGERFQTFNCHQLLHLSEDVKCLGPLWTSSCFPFEDYNGDLKDLFHGTLNIPSQVTYPSLILFSVFFTVQHGDKHAFSINELLIIYYQGFISRPEQICTQCSS